MKSILKILTGKDPVDFLISRNMDRDLEDRCCLDCDNKPKKFTFVSSKTKSIQNLLT